MEEARIKYQSRTLILHMHLHLTKVLGWHNLSETSFLISQHRWKRYAYLNPYLKRYIQPSRSRRGFVKSPGEVQTL
jgi:hypothetical protein